MGWKYGGKRGQIDPEAARWLNFWTLIGVAFIFILCLIGANGDVSAVEANPILSLLSLLGIISLLVTPFLFFISYPNSLKVFPTAKVEKPQFSS